jgi:hypothetical protein
LHHVANLSFSACDAMPLYIPSHKPYVYITNRNFTLLTATVIIAWRYWCDGKQKGLAATDQGKPQRPRKDISQVYINSKPHTRAG